MENVGMELTGLLKALVEHEKTGKGYQIQVNSGNMDKKSAMDIGIDIGDIYFTGCETFKNQTLLCFTNMKREPIGELADGTNLYPNEINTQIFLDLNKIQRVEEIEDFEDWFIFGSERVFNIYLLPGEKNISGNMVVTLGLMS